MCFPRCELRALSHYQVSDMSQAVNQHQAIATSLWGVELVLNCICNLDQSECCTRHCTRPLGNDAKEYCYTIKSINSLICPLAYNRTIHHKTCKSLVPKMVRCLVPVLICIEIDETTPVTCQRKTSRTPRYFSSMILLQENCRRVGCDA